MWMDFYGKYWDQEYQTVFGWFPTLTQYWVFPCLSNVRPQWPILQLYIESVQVSSFVFGLKSQNKQEGHSQLQILLLFYKEGQVFVCLESSHFLEQKVSYLLLNTLHLIGHSNPKLMINKHLSVYVYLLCQLNYHQNKRLVWHQWRSCLRPLLLFRS